MKYVVTVYEVHSLDIEVEADNPDQAREAANAILEDGEAISDIDSSYDYTMEPEEWKVTQQ